MKNSMESLEKKFGSVEFEGKKYILIQDAYIDDVCIDGQEGHTAYFADAIKDGDHPDEDGYFPLYTVEWEIIESQWDDEESQWEDEDEGNRCDWDNPVDVRITRSMYNIEEDSVF